MWQRWAVMIALASLQACASSGAAPPRGSPNLITREEIDALEGDVSNALQVVERLRPTMLAPRGSFSIQGGTATAVVYVNQVRLGEPRSLATISASAVLTIRYIGSADATTRYGTGHPGGVIEVDTRRPAPGGAARRDPLLARRATDGPPGPPHERAR